MAVAGVLGTLLRERRRAAGLSQEELAERAGLSPKEIGALERGERTRPRPATLRALVSALGLSRGEHEELLVSTVVLQEARTQRQPCGDGAAVSAASAAIALRYRRPPGQLPGTLISGSRLLSMTSGNALHVGPASADSASGNGDRPVLPPPYDAVLDDYAAALERAPLAPSSRHKYLSRVRGFLAGRPSG